MLGFCALRDTAVFQVSRSETTIPDFLFFGVWGVVARDCKLFGRVATRPERDLQNSGNLRVRKTCTESLYRASKKVAVAGGVGRF